MSYNTPVARRHPASEVEGLISVEVAIMDHPDVA